MSATIKLLDTYKKVCLVRSDSEAAQRLGVTRGAVHLWKKGSSHPDVISIEKMCIAIGEPTQRWLPLIEAERAHSPAAKSVWLRLAQAAASIAMIYLSSHLDGQTIMYAFTPLYIMRSCERRGGGYS